jgi:hypothetical protein
MLCLKSIKNKICKIESNSSSERVSLEYLVKNKLQILHQELNQIDSQIDSLKNNNGGALSSQDTIKYRLLSSQRQEKYSQIESVLQNNPIFQLERSQRELASLQNPRGRRLKQAEIIQLSDEIIVLKNKIRSMEEKLNENQEKIDQVPDGAIAAYLRIRQKLEKLLTNPDEVIATMPVIARDPRRNYIYNIEQARKLLVTSLNNITAKYDGISIAAAKVLSSKP